MTLTSCFSCFPCQTPGAGAGGRAPVRELALPLVPSEDSLDDLGPEPLVMTHDSEVIAESYSEI